MPTIQQMRKYVSDAYPGRQWQMKVAKMSESQVFAMYYRMQRLPKKGKS